MIDVIRAYTTAAWALHLGASRLLLVDDVEAAVALAGSFPGALLCKDGDPDSRFELHNSPGQLREVDVAGKTIIQRTTAGTTAAVAARRADHVFCAGLVAASATAKGLTDLGCTDVTFVVSGGLQADEDLACAELIAALVDDPSTDPSPFVERAARSTGSERLRAGVAIGFRGVHRGDISMCLDVDRFDFAMESRDHGTHLELVVSNGRRSP